MLVGGSSVSWGHYTLSGCCLTAPVVLPVHISNTDKEMKHCWRRFQVESAHIMLDPSAADQEAYH